MGNWCYTLFWLERQWQRKDIGPEREKEHQRQNEWRCGRSERARGEKESLCSRRHDAGTKWTSTRNRRRTAIWGQRMQVAVDVHVSVSDSFCLFLCRPTFCRGRRRWSWCSSYCASLAVSLGLLVLPFRQWLMHFEWAFSCDQCCGRSGAEGSRSSRSRYASSSPRPARTMAPNTDCQLSAWSFHTLPSSLVLNFSPTWVPWSDCLSLTVSLYCWWCYFCAGRPRRRP